MPKSVHGQFGDGTPTESHTSETRRSRSWTISAIVSWPARSYWGATKQIDNWRVVELHREKDHSLGEVGVIEAACLFQEVTAVRVVARVKDTPMAVANCGGNGDGQYKESESHQRAPGSAERPGRASSTRDALSPFRRHTRASR